METKQKTLEDDLNNALAYSYVLGWYAGSDGVKTDKGKWQHDHMKQAAEDIEDIKADHPGIVQACNAHEDLLEACKIAMIVLEKAGPTEAYVKVRDAVIDAVGLKAAIELAAESE